MSRRLRAFGIRYRRPYHGPVLTRRHRQIRNNFAQNHQQRVNWHDIVFSDESRFNLFHKDGQMPVYQCNEERYADNCVVELDRFGGIGLLVWGAINYSFHSRLLIIHGNLTARRYVDEILRPELVPLLRRQLNPMVFQQDNARPHMARLTQDFLRQEGINILPWPSKSPDLNPIEHLWDELGHRVRGRQNVPQTVRQLEWALQQEWNNIPRRTARRLCTSMGSRLCACSQSAGGHTRY